MEIDLEPGSPEHNYFNKDRSLVLTSYQDFFQKQKSVIADSRNLLMKSDPNSTFLYLISNHMYILDQSTYEVHKKIYQPEILKLENPENIISFKYSENNIFLLYNENFLFLFPMISNTVVEMCIEHRITFLNNEEHITKIYNIENEMELPYLLLITSFSNIYLLKIKFEDNFKTFDFAHELLNEKVGILRKFFSNFVSTADVTKVFVLNPTPYTKFLRHGRKNNVLFLFNESYLKKIEFNVGTRAIEGELTLQVNPINLITERLKPLYKTLHINSKNISIESAEIYQDKLKRVNTIFYIVKYEQEQLSSSIRPSYASHFFIFTSSIHLDSNDISFNLLFNFNELENFGRNTVINFSQIILNKYQQEYFVFFSGTRHSEIYFFSSQYPNQFFDTTSAMEIRGFNIQNTAETFSVDVLSTDSGLFDISFNGNRICLSDKTEIFYKNVINLDSNLSGSADKSRIWENILSKSKTPLKGSYLNTLDYEMSHQEANTNEITNILQNEFRYFLEKLLSNQPIDQKMKEHEINNFLQMINTFKADEKIIFMMKSIIDDEKQNVDNINKESIKAELVIIEYLREKEKKFDVFYEFLKYYRVFDQIDKNQTIFYKFLEYKEKLTVAIKLREFENNIIDRLKSSDFAFKKIPPQDEKYYSVAHDYFKLVYDSLKKSQNLDKPFYKQSIFSKISEIHVFLEKISENFLIKAADIKNKEDRVILAKIMINLFEIILSSVIFIHEKYLYEGMGADSIDLKIYEMRKNPESLWLLRYSYLEQMETFLTKFLEFRPNILQSTLNEIFSFTDNLLYFIELFHKVNFSVESEKAYFLWRRKILSHIIELDYEKSLNLSRKYKDFFSVTYICHRKKWLNKLKETMMEYKDQTKVIKDILKIYLLFESSSIKKSINNTKNFEFSFFEDFDEFNQEIKEICANYPKLNFQYEIYLKNKNVNDYNEIDSNLENFVKKIVNKQNLNIYLKIAKIFNNLSRLNYEEFTMKNQEGNDITEILDNFYIRNENNGLELNYMLLVNYLVCSLKLPQINYENGSIFHNFEIFMTNYLKNDSKIFGENAQNVLKYRIAINLIQMAEEINYKFGDKEIFDRLRRAAYERAILDDYLNLNKEFSEYKVDDIESLSDNQKKNLLSKSFLHNLVQEFPSHGEFLKHILRESGNKFEAKDKVLRPENFLKLFS